MEIKEHSITLLVQVLGNMFKNNYEQEQQQKRNLQQFY